MHKESVLHARLETKLKKEAEKIFNEVGLSASEAIRVFYKQVIIRNGLPFDVRIPNKETIKAMREARSEKTLKAKSVKDLLNSIK